MLGHWLLGGVSCPSTDLLVEDLDRDGGQAVATRFEAAADTIAQAVQLAILGASAVYLTFYPHVCVHH